MSKAICEIEKPKCCKECVWYQADAWFGGVCTISKDENGWSKDIGADEEYDVQKWCPLLPKNEAIPKEWIKHWCIKHYPTYPRIITEELLKNTETWRMIEDWEKESDKESE